MGIVVRYLMHIRYQKQIGVEVVVKRNAYVTVVMLAGEVTNFGLTVPG
jgi:hypothetical protein